MSTTKQVKVDNWGVFFLQRLKHFFNRTDYCDLTLQFQDYAQLKVHRLVLNACTEYFELLEKTCEMYDDCLIMPDDLQVDVVVPIVNFMYTGQLEYEVALFERLYSTAQIMNMTVLTKLLDAQKEVVHVLKPPKKEIILMNEQFEKRSYVPKSNSDPSHFPKKRLVNRRQYGPGPGLKAEPAGRPPPKTKYDSPRPTRYEVPEELENEDIFESSFADISYESRPLMKPAKNRDFQEVARSQNIYDEASCSRKFEELQRGTSYKRPRSSSSDTPDGRQIDLDQVNEFAYQQKLRAEYIAQEEQSDDEMFDNLNMEYDKDNPTQSHIKEEAGFLFSQVNDPSKPKGAAAKDPRANLNHAKIISEVLKKYPHLVKNNKNIKLKIMSGASKPQSPKNIPKSFVSNQQKKFCLNSSSKVVHEEEEDKPEWSYVSKNMNSEAMAKLVSLGAGNTSGPWLCLMCGTPGKALNFSSYQHYYQHLVGVHKEKISANICEHCGYKSGKRNHLLHHLYTKHGVPPPSTHSFPKCNQCSYIALTEAFLIKHKLSHLENRDFSCNVCNAQFRTRSQMLFHIQVSGHKISPDRKTSNQCVYCNKIFLRETNLYTHLKLAHKDMARKDGIIDNSDEDEALYEDEINKYADVGSTNKYAQGDHIRIKDEYDGKFQIISNVVNKPARSPQKLLNSQLSKTGNEQNKKFIGSSLRKINREESSNIVQIMKEGSDGDALETVSASLGLVDRIVVLNDNEYILQSEQGDIMDDTVSHVQVGLDNDSSEILLSDLQGEEYSSQATLEVSLPQQSSSSQISTARSFKPSQKNGSSRNYVNSQNQPIQIVVSGNKQYNSIVSTASVVYTSSETKTVDSISPLKYIQSQPDTVQLQATPDGTVMVLQDQDFTNMTDMTQQMPSDGSNIVVVYSHPIEPGQKGYVQVDQTQLTEVNQHSEDRPDVESHMEDVEADRTETEVVLSEQGLVHETVETWQEEISQEEGKQDEAEEVQCSEYMVIDTEIPLAEDDKVSIPDECNTSNLEKSEECEELSESAELAVSEPNEVVVSTQETDSHVSSEIDIENPHNDEESPQQMSMEEASSCADQEGADVNISSTEHDQVDSLEQGVPMEADERAEVEADESAAVESETSAQEDAPSDRQQIDKLTLEWSDDESSFKKTSTDAPDAAKESTVSQDSQHMEVEESIENIEKEVQKHILERDAELQVDDQNCEANNGQNEDLKQHKSGEKISSLLNDWEDHDSQGDSTAPPNQTQTANPQASIHKLVSDWDDEEDK